MSIDLSGYVAEEIEVKIGGKKFWFSHLTMSDLSLIRKKIKNERKEENQKRREEIFVRAEKAGGVDILELLKYLDRPLSETEIEEMMEAFDSVITMCYLSLRHHYKDITEDEAASLVTQNDLPTIMKALNPEEEEPSIKITMKQLSYKVKLEGGKETTINELLNEASKKKRNRKPVKN